MNISDLTNAERETHINMVADDRSTWHVYSDDPVMLARLEKIGAKLVRTEAHGGKHFTLPANQVSLRKPPRKLTEEQREAARHQLAAARAAALTK